MKTVGFLSVLNIWAIVRISITAIFLIQSSVSLGQNSSFPEKNRPGVEKHDQFFYGAVSDFIEVRLYELIKLVSGKGAGRFIEEKTNALGSSNRHYIYRFSLENYLTVINFSKNDSGEILLRNSYISGANIQTDDKDAIHLLSRLGIKTRKQSGIVQVKIESTYMEIEYSGDQLIGIYLFSSDRLTNKE